MVSRRGAGRRRKGGGRTEAAAGNVAPRFSTKPQADARRRHHQRDGACRRGQAVRRDSQHEESRRDRQQAGANVHLLPEKPALVDDDGEFRYVVLGPAGASESGKPSAFARRFLDETTGADRPRTNRNAIVVAVPSREGVEAARQAVRDHQGWLAVQDALTKDGHQLDYTRQQSLDTYISTAARRVTDTIVQAYSIVVTVSDQNQAQAFKVQVTDSPLFGVIKADSRSRIQETAISPDAMLPGGPYRPVARE